MLTATEERRIQAAADIARMGTETPEGLARIADRVDHALRMANAGLISVTEAEQQVRTA